jgi:uncharacterized cupredoxin-like copper-binding protein
MPRLGRFDGALIGGILIALGVAGIAAAWSAGRAGPGPADATTVEIVLRYSRFEPSARSVPAGVPVTVTLRNEDPIDHEWILGDEAVHARHRAGTEPVHGARPTEVTVPAGETRITTVVLDAAGTFRYVCHLPGHEGYGMSGELTANL